MQSLIIGMLLGVFFFVCSYMGFRQGLRLGMNTAKGMIPDAIKSPITALKEHKLNKEQEKKRAKEEAEFMRMLNYNGEAIPKEGEE